MTGTASEIDGNKEFNRRLQNPRKGAEVVIPIDKTIELMIMFSTLVLLIVSSREKK